MKPLNPIQKQALSFIRLHGFEPGHETFKDRWAFRLKRGDWMLPNGGTRMIKHSTMTALERRGVIRWSMEEMVRRGDVFETWPSRAELVTPSSSTPDDTASY